MESRRPPPPPTAPVLPFDVQAFLNFAGKGKAIRKYARGESIFLQGDSCDGLFYIQTGDVKLSVRSKAGKEAVVAMLGPGDFFGEGCIANQPVRMDSATTITASTILFIRRDAMVRMLREQHALSDRFISHILSRNRRMEEDLVDQLFNSSEKRLARALLLLVHFGSDTAPARAVPKITQETLAEMIGSTRPRVNFFLNKFKRLGYIDYDGRFPLKINASLVSILLAD